MDVRLDGTAARSRFRLLRVEQWGTSEIITVTSVACSDATPLPSKIVMPPFRLEVRTVHEPRRGGVGEMRRKRYESPG